MDSNLVPLQQSPRYAATLRRMGCHVEVLAHDGPPLHLLCRRAGPLHIAYAPRVPPGADLGAVPRAWLRLVIPEAPAFGITPRPARGSSSCPRDDAVRAPDPGMANRDAGPAMPAVANRTGAPTSAWAGRHSPRPPGSPARRNAGLPLLTGQWVAEITAPPCGTAHLWHAMQPKWRNRLRRALDTPPATRITRYDPVRDAGLMAREMAMRRSRGYRTLPPAFFQAWAAENPHQTCLLRAERRDVGEPLAWMLFLLHGPVATYALGWTGEDGRKRNAHALLLWLAMRTLFARGFLRLDLGTVETDTAPGLARFKLGSGAVARQLGPTLLIPPGRRVGASWH